MDRICRHFMAKGKTLLCPVGESKHISRLLLLIFRLKRGTRGERNPRVFNDVVCPGTTRVQVIVRFGTILILIFDNEYYSNRNIFETRTNVISNLSNKFILRLFLFVFKGWVVRWMLFVETPNVWRDRLSGISPLPCNYIHH